MARVLLAWELGGGLGHGRRLVHIAERLSEAGHQVAFATTFDGKMNAMTAGRWPVSATPQWTRIAAGPRAGFTAATFGDILAEYLFQDPGEIEHQVAHWQKLIAAQQADMVIADYAPTALLACRGNTPVLNIGDSYYLPPTDVSRFPRLFGVPPVHSEEDVAERVSAVLARLALPRLEHYPDVARATSALVTNFPELDVYASYREGGQIGPLELDARPLPAMPKQGRIFGYLPQGAEFNRRIMDGIRGAGLPGLVVIPGMVNVPGLNSFDAPTKFTGRLADMATAFQDVSVFITHGGAQTVAAALASGVPQVILAQDDEKQLLAHRLVKLGVAVSINVSGVQSSELAQMIREVATLKKMQKAARLVASSCQSLLNRNPTAQLIETVQALVMKT